MISMCLDFMVRAARRRFTAENGRVFEMPAVGPIVSIPLLRYAHSVQAFMGDHPTKALDLLRITIPLGWP